MKRNNKALLVSCLLVLVSFSAYASPLPFALYLNPEQPLAKRIIPLQEYMPRYAVIFAECTESEVVYTGMEWPEGAPEGIAEIRASFQPLWLSDESFSAFAGKPMTVRSPILTTDGTSPFEAGKGYALFGAITNGQSNPTQFTVGNMAQSLSAELTHKGKPYAYASVDPSAPCWLEVSQSPMGIKTFLQENLIWRGFLTMASIHAQSLYVPASITDKDAIGLTLSSGMWPDNSAPADCAVSAAFAKKNGLGIGDSLTVQPYPLAPSLYKGEDSSDFLGDEYTSLENLTRSGTWFQQTDSIKMTIVGIYEAGESAPGWANHGNAVILR